MFKVEGTTITLSRGDTGALKLKANTTILATGEEYTFGEEDRALFTIKSANGQIVKQQAYEIVDNEFVVIFSNQDTDTFAPGNYRWDVRYVINPYYDEHGQIVDGDQVITPNTPMQTQLLDVVGDI